jgi:hypothetical protein
MMKDMIYKQDAINALNKLDVSDGVGISSVACDLQEEAIHSIENLPSAQPEQQWIPCSEKEAEYPCLACDVFGQIFITNNGIVRINGECYDGTGFDFSNAEEFLKGIKVGNSMRMLPRKIVAWSPLPEPYKGGEDE